MPLAGTIRKPPRQDALVARVARSWRRLTGGTARGTDHLRRTLLACSAGADSSAMVLALAGAVRSPERVFVVGHIVHDLRPRRLTLADRDAAEQLARRLGLPFAEDSVRALERGGNAEAAARELRYAALSRLASDHGCRFIATAHHADDQFETILMALLRGAGPAGLAGIAARRAPGGPAVVRPMLELSREDCRRLCREAGWEWREDATNRDRTRLRAAIRYGLLPQIERLRPGAAAVAGRAAALLRDAAGLVADRANALNSAAHAEGGSEGLVAIRWPRALLRAERSIVLGAALKEAAARLCGGSGRDRTGAKLVGPVVRAIRGRGTDPRSFDWSRVGVHVTAHSVEVRLKVPRG